jgi:ankyrin repeat protein
MTDIDKFKSAIEKNNVSEVKTLVMTGADINSSDIFGYTPLHWAAMKGASEAIEVLIAAGANKDKPCLNYKFAPLHNAINENQNSAINSLINNGANLMAKDKDGNTPLHFASMMGNDLIVHKLISKGVNVNATDNQGVTPIFLANYCGHSNIVNILRNAGAH